MFRRLFRRLFARTSTPLHASSADARGDVDLSVEAQRMLTDINFYAQVIENSKRTILCQPRMLDAIREAVDARDLGGVYTVRASQACPDGKLLILDEQAMEASFQQAAQRSARSLYP